MDLFDLRGRVAVVTGGNGGIGLGIAEGFARAGAMLVLAGRNRDKGRAAVERIEALGTQALFVEADLSTEAACTALVSQAVRHFDRLDILVNNAGIHLPAPASHMSVGDWAREIEVNLTGPFLCCKAAHPFLARRGGKVINIGSLASHFGMVHGANYCASKGGILQLTRALAVEWAADDIQVNAILPGWISTDIMAPAQHGVPGFDEMIVRRSPARRWGQPADLAGTAVFLASDASAFVTGTAIPVDGGFSVALF
jgi:2-deoxy-D-gluconate 3-dehydrogenase